MPSIYKQGALWRRWDLHIHSPESIAQQFGGPPSWPQFIEALEHLPDEVKVVGITDYYFIDGYERVINEKLKNEKLKNLEKIFPILEFRIDTFSSASQSKLYKINLHILFDVDEDNVAAEIQLIRERFIERINLSGAEEHKTIPLSKENMAKESSDGKLATGFRDFVPSTNQVFQILKEKPWKDKTLVFLGYEEWHNLDKGVQAKIQKQRLYKRADTFLSASSVDAISQKQEVLQQFGNKVFFHSLDIHSFEQFQKYRCLTWIKADPSFKGLKHALLNTKERVFIGHAPPRLQYERENPEYFIEALTFQSTTTSLGWFDDIPPIVLNNGLVAIIGDKGNGKSALADILALGANSSREHYSFLRKDQFLASGAHKRYSAILSFCDNTSNPLSFSDPKYTASKPERVTYLSQSFVNQLCDVRAGAQELQAEIDRVIFAHLPEGKRLKQNSLAQVVRRRAGAFDAGLEELREELSNINVEIVRLEECVDDEYQKRIQALAEQQAAALEQHEASKPKPPAVTGSSDASVKLVAKYVKCKAEFEELTETRWANVTNQEYERAHLQQGKERLLGLNEKMTELVNELAADEIFANNNIDVKSLVTIDVKTQPIDAVCDKKDTFIASETKYIERVEALKEQIGQLVDRLRTGQTEAERLQNNYVVDTQNWEKKKAQLTGSENDKDTLEWYRKELKRIVEDYPVQLTERYEKRQEIARKIVDTLFDKEDAIKDIYSYVQTKAGQYAKELKMPKSEFIEFTARITIADSFKTDLFALVDHNRAGTFYRVDRASAQLEALLPFQIDVDKAVLLALPDAVLHALQHNLQNDPPEKRKVKDQLVGDKLESKQKLYDFLFSFKYVTGRFSITYTGKPITKLSPGEKGILLLAFYLLMDDNPNPMIVDQPEENIGNLTIARRLVDFIKLARQKRQVIIVTHSATLAIVCDADQIIHCAMDKVHGNAIVYTSGSIEYDEVKRSSIDILEGTQTSFDSRKHVWDMLPSDERLERAKGIEPSS